MICHFPHNVTVRIYEAFSTLSQYGLHPVLFDSIANIVMVQIYEVFSTLSQYGLLPVLI